MEREAVIVGYEGSASARIALRWAVDEAARQGLPVKLVYAVPRPVRRTGVPRMLGDVPADEAWAAAQSAIDHGLAEVAALTRQAASGRAGAVDATGTVLEGSAATVLCEQSRQARVLVLGSRGLGGFTGLFVGSTSIAVATHAACPVVVVRDGDPAPAAGRPIAVGVDESPEAQLALGFALEQAAARRVDLLAVRAWRPPAPPWRSDVRPLVTDVAELEAAERQLVAHALHGWRDKYRTVKVVTRLIPTDARHALTTVSHEAQLIVVGSRGPGGFEGLLLGSVSHYLLHHATCPVAVVRQYQPR
jgi:nucleotide-binding universal stress UspA family protein